MRSKNQEKTNAIISKKAKKRWADRKYKVRVSKAMKGKVRTKEHRKATSEGLKTYYKLHPKPKGPYKQVECACGCRTLIRYGEKLAKYVNKEHRRWARELRKMAKPEHYCKYCGKVCNRDYCSQSCSTKGAWTGQEYRESRIVEIGKLSRERWDDPEYKEMMCKKAKERAADPEWRKQHSEAITRYMNLPEVKKANGKRMTKWLRKKWKDPEYREKMTQVARDNWEREEFRNKMRGPKKYITGWFKAEKGGRIYYRGSWEFFFILLLDSAAIVRKFKHQPFGIPYTFKGESHTYFPDFLVTLINKEKWLMEIKGQERENDPAKYKAAEKYCERRGYKYIVLKGSSYQDIVTNDKIQSLSRYVQ